MKLKNGELIIGKNISFLATLILFCIIYHPPLLTFNILYLIAPVTWIYLIAHRNYLKQIINVEYLYKVYLWLVIIIIYESIISFINNYSVIAVSVGMIWWAIAIIPVCIATLCYIKLKGYSDITIINSLEVAAWIQCIFGILGFLFPSIQSLFLKNIQQQYSSITYMFSYRMYGFATYLTGFTAMAQGFLALIFLYLGINYKRKYLRIVPFLVFVGLINARTSAVIFVVGVVVLFLFSHFDMKYKLGSIIALLILCVAGYFGIVYLQNNNTNGTIVWILDGYNEIVDFFNGKTSGYFIYATNDSKYVLPTGIQFIFGAGTKIFLKSDRIPYTTDIGFINDFWCGGLILVLGYYLLLLWLFISFYKEHKKSGGKNSLSLLMIMITTFLLANFKGIFNTDNDLVSVYFFLIVSQLMICSRDRDIVN